MRLRPLRPTFLDSRKLLLDSPERLRLQCFSQQAYVEFGRQLAKGLNLKGGLFEFNNGQDLVPEDGHLKWLVLNEISQRLIGNFGWSVVMRSFDGAMVRYGPPDWNFTAMYCVPTRGVFESQRNVRNS